MVSLFSGVNLGSTPALSNCNDLIWSINNGGSQFGEETGIFCNYRGIFIRLGYAGMRAFVRVKN
jgi:hypothetical protein